MVSHYPGHDPHKPGERRAALRRWASVGGDMSGRTVLGGLHHGCFSFHGKRGHGDHTTLQCTTSTARQHPGDSPVKREKGRRE